MDLTNKEVPVEILVDIKENEKILCSHTSISIKESIKPSNTKIEKELKTKIQSSNNEDLFSKNCPIAVLVDVSPPARSSFKDIFSSNASVSAELFKDKSDFLDSKEKSSKNSNYDSDCKSEESLNSSNSSGVQWQIPVESLRWRTPSPKSMSCISKEASKVIDQLNSSSIFNEDLLLTEEILPLALNFDELDETDQGNSDDNVFEDIISKKDSIIGEQMLSRTENSNEKLNSFSKNVSFKKCEFQDNLEHTHVRKIVNDSNFKASNKTATNSNESCSSRIHSSSLNYSDSLTFCDEVDVFNVTHIASEDKENIQNKSNKVKIPKNKTAFMISSLNKSKLDQCGRLRNLSNIKPEASVKNLSVNKSITTPLKRMNISTSKKSTVPHTEKLQMKKTTLSVDSHYSMKGFNQSRCTQFSNAISSKQKLQAATKFDSGCSSLISDVKKQNAFATPSRRYSVCTPLKSASAMKPPLTPFVKSSHTFAFPRYTPQPSKPSRLSFSRSWQQFDRNPHLFLEKELKQEMSTIMPSNSSKIALGIKNSAKPIKLSFSQSMSAVSAKSLEKNASSKGKFSNKLQSHLAADKKVARALFRNVSEK